MRAVALLRSLNVGAHNRITMKDLAQVFVDVGCTDVATYIQSGNVVFTASAALLKKLPALVAAKLAAEHQVVSPVVLRDAKQLAAVVAGNPFLRRGEAPSTLHVSFLASAPAAEKVAALDPKRGGADQFEVRGAEVYLFFAQGAGKTKLSAAWFDAKLGVVGTWRNWNTVLELAKRAAA